MHVLLWTLLFRNCKKILSDNSRIGAKEAYIHVLSIKNVTFDSAKNAASAFSWHFEHFFQSNFFTFADRKSYF